MEDEDLHAVLAADAHIVDASQPMFGKVDAGRLLHDGTRDGADVVNTFHQACNPKYFNNNILLRYVPFYSIQIMLFQHMLLVRPMIRRARPAA
jgi:hypothetical protein